MLFACWITDLNNKTRMFICVAVNYSMSIVQKTLIQHGFITKHREGRMGFHEMTRIMKIVGVISSILLVIIIHVLVIFCCKLQPYYMHRSVPDCRQIIQGMSHNHMKTKY